MTDFFPGFARRRIATSDADINLVTGGSGRPLLLLPLPERLIGAEPEFFLRHSLRDPAVFEPEAFAEYLRCFENPETIRATCAEYRAGATIDLVHDRADRGRRLTMPLLVLWGERSSQGSGYDVLGVSRDHAETVS